MPEQSETRIILAEDDQIDRIADSIENADDVSLVHRYGSLLIVEVQAGAAGSSALSGLRVQSPQEVTDDQRRNLEEAARWALDSLLDVTSDPSYSASAVPDRTPRPVKTGCVRPPSTAMTSDAEQLHTSRPTSSRLTGRVSVGLVIISGPGDDLTITDDEAKLVVAKTRVGAQWLGNQPPPVFRASWLWDVRRVTIDVPADAPADDDESRYRDPALAKLGFEAGSDGVLAYMNRIRDQLRTRWTYAAFFAKYPPKYMGYAVGPPNYIVMDPRNGTDKDGQWGPQDTDRIFAHETGHVFGAPDEYGRNPNDPDFKPGEDTCRCDERFGIFQRPNTNCEWCAPNGGVDCVMRGCDWTMCSQTPWHLGFGNLSPGV